LTPEVETVNVAELWPARTDTVAGTVAAPMLLDKLTTTPPVPAGLLKVTVPVDGIPP
jgi:hypothetical protein